MKIFHNDRLKLGIILLILGIGFLIGFLGENSLKFLIFIGIAFLGVIYFFRNFEISVIGLLILRSSLDIFDETQIPALYAIGIDVLTILYVIKEVINAKHIQTDRFWWFLTSWVAFQGLWVVLLVINGLGYDASFFSNSLREWVRLFSFLMVYLLVMQLKGKVSPEWLIGKLYLALVIPVSTALLQLIVPPESLPPLIIPTTGLLEGTSRISGTFSHSASFAKFIFLFLGITYWKIEQNKQRFFWGALLVLFAFLIAATKSMTGLIMAIIFILVLIIPRINVKALCGGFLIVALLATFFASTEYGQERLDSLQKTPLFNSDITVSRATLMQEQVDEGNSFNWRVSHWNALINDWKKAPILGYGLGTSKFLGGQSKNISHNDYIGSLVETGVVGFISFIIFLGGQAFYLSNLIRTCPPGSSQKKFCTALLAIHIAWLVGMSTDNIWRVTSVVIYWWTLFSVASWNWTNELKE